MYDPFNLNDYLGQLTVLAIVGKAVMIAVAIPVYRRFLEIQESKWRRK